MKRSRSSGTHSEKLLPARNSNEHWPTRLPLDTSIGRACACACVRRAHSEIPRRREAHHSRASLRRISRPARWRSACGEIAPLSPRLRVPDRAVRASGSRRTSSPDNRVFCDAGKSSFLARRLFSEILAPERVVRRSRYPGVIRLTSLYIFKRPS